MITKLAKHWRKLVVLALVGTAMLVEALVLTADHWWKKLGEARVAYNGQPSTMSHVYCSRDGNFLVFLAEEGEPSLYVVYPGNDMVGMPNRSNFVLLPGYAYSKSVPPLIALMQSVKIEVNPQLIVQPQLIEFNSFDQGRVRVTW